MPETFSHFFFFFFVRLICDFQLSTSDERHDREEWMTELPPEKGSQFGLEARKFRTSYSDAKADRSSWTQAPNSACKKPTVPFSICNTRGKDIVIRQIDSKFVGRIYRKKPFRSPRNF